MPYLDTNIYEVTRGPSGDTAVIFNRDTGLAGGFRCLGDDLNDILDVTVQTSHTGGKIFLIGGPVHTNVKGPEETFRLACLLTASQPPDPPDPPDLPA